MRRRITYKRTKFDDFHAVLYTWSCPVWTSDATSITAVVYRRSARPRTVPPGYVHYNMPSSYIYIMVL